MALIPPFFLDCVVTIGTGSDPNEREWKASGFLYGERIGTDDADEQKYRIYLVSNRHVFEEISEESIYLRFNPKDVHEAVHDYELPLIDKNGQRVWVAHPDPEIDVAVTNINYRLLREHAMQVNFFRGDVHGADIKELSELGITEGDFLYVLGFPMGLVGQKRNVVIVRNGTIARIRDVVNGMEPEYLIDSFVFPGNSGGPVVSKPESIAITGTKAQSSAYLIGIVKSAVKYRDVAISIQTRRPRVIFEENSGLADVHPIDYIYETIEEHGRILGELSQRKELFYRLK